MRRIDAFEDFWQGGGHRLNSPRVDVRGEGVGFAVSLAQLLAEAYSQRGRKLSCPKRPDESEIISRTLKEYYTNNIDHLTSPNMWSQTK